MVWAKKQGSNVGSNIIPIQVGYLKQLQQRQECILMGWGWTAIEVQYTVKFSGNPARTAFGMSDFLDSKYEKLQELSRTVKSPYLADLERRVNPYK